MVKNQALDGRKLQSPSPLSPALVLGLALDVGMKLTFKLVSSGAVLCRSVLWLQRTAIVFYIKKVKGNQRGI